MATKKLCGIGTLRADRTRHCPLLSEKELKAKGRGSSQQIISTDRTVVITPWFDNKRVLVSSNFIAVEPKTQCRMYDRKNKTYIQVDRPATVTIYNKFMGGYASLNLSNKISHKKVVPPNRNSHFQSGSCKCLVHPQRIV